MKDVKKHKEKIFFDKTNNGWFEKKLRSIDPKFNKMKSKMFGGIIPTLIKMRITPNQITFFNFMLGIISLIFLYFNLIYLFIIFGVIYFFLDWLDGFFAVETGKATKAGAILDYMSDHIFILLLFLVVGIKYDIMILSTLGALSLFFEEWLYFCIKISGMSYVPIHTNYVFLFGFFGFLLNLISIENVLFIVIIINIIGSLRAIYLWFKIKDNEML